MTFRQFAFNNVFRNKRLYIAYFLSSLFTVTVFFTFANFAFHPGVSGEDLKSSVQLGLFVAGGIIYVFSFFYILYSMSSFLQSRKKEFGLLMIQGMSHQQIRRMVFLENMIIGTFATVAGILIGLIFSKLILMIAENVLTLELTMNFYFPTAAILLTFISFIVLFVCISLFVTFVLRTSKLVQLIKGSQAGKAEPKASVILTIMAVLLLGTGYFIALTSKGEAVVFALVPVVLLVTFGTYLLFTQLSVYVIRKLKSNEKLFWKKTNMLLFSDLSYRMKDNARSFFMVAIISTVAFSAIGTLFGLNSLLTSGMKAANPYSFSYYVNDESEISTIEKVFSEYHLTVEKAEAELPSYDLGQNDFGTMVITPEAYNEFAKLAHEKEIKVGANEVVIVGQSSANMMGQDKDWDKVPLVLENGESYAPEAASEVGAKPDIIPAMGAYYIAGEDVYAQLGEPEDDAYHMAWNVVEGSQDDIIEAGKVLQDAVPAVMSIDLFIYTTKLIWSPTMFVGLFIGLVFFVSAGSFLYFRLYTDLDEDKAKFLSISKIGLTSKEMNKVISKQIALLFFTPIIVAILHGAVALTALAHMFDYNLVKESLIVLGGFTIIQIVYFIIVRYFYVRQIKQYVKLI